MRYNSILVLFASSILILTACGEETNNDTAPANTYLESRVSTIDLAKNSLKKNNQRIKEQNKNIDALIHQ